MFIVAISSGQTLLVALLVGVSLLLNVSALVVLLKRPTWAFEQARVGRMTWILLLALSWIIGCGWVTAFWYLFMVDPKVKNQQSLGGPPGFPGRM